MRRDPRQVQRVRRRDLETPRQASRRDAAAPTFLSHLDDRTTWTSARAWLRLRHEPGLPVEAQGRGRSPRRRHPPPAAQRHRPVLLEVVDGRLLGCARRVGPARRRARAGSHLAGAGGDLRRPRVPRRAGGPLVRLPARQARVDGRRAHRHRPCLPRPHGSDRGGGIALELFDLGDDRLRGRNGLPRRDAPDHAPRAAAPSPPGPDAGRRGGHPLRRLRHLDQGAHRHRAGRVHVDHQPVDDGGGPGLDRSVLRIGPRPPGGRGRGGDRAHVGRGEPQRHPRRHPRVRRPDGRQRFRDRRSRHGLRDGARRDGADAGADARRLAGTA